MKESPTKKQTANQTGGKYKKRETEEQKQKKRGKHQGNRKKKENQANQGTFKAQIAIPFTEDRLGRAKQSGNETALDHPCIAKFIL